MDNIFNGMDKKSIQEKLKEYRSNLGTQKHLPADPRWVFGSSGFEDKFDTETWQAFVKEMTVTEYGSFETELNTAMNKVEEVYKKYNEIVANRLAKHEQQANKKKLIAMLNNIEKVNSNVILLDLAVWNLIDDQQISSLIREKFKS